MRNKLINLLHDPPIILLLVILLVMLGIMFMPEISLFHDAFVTRSWKTLAFAILFLIIDITVLCIVAFFWIIRKRR